jgi:hypothetical protein
MITMWVWVLGRFTSPEILTLTVGVTIEIVRQLAQARDWREAPDVGW